MWKKYKKLPILGVHNSGKTYFLISLGYLVSKYRWGEVSKEASVYFNSLLPYVLKGTPIPPTYKNFPIEIKIRDIVLPTEKITCNFILYTEDFPGAEYEIAMDEMSAEVKEELVKFYNLYKKSDGIIAIIDLVGNVTAEKFRENKEEYILNAFSKQIVPLAKGIELVLEVANLQGKPIFFIFTKSDVHRLSVNEISKYFDRIMAITLARLESMGVIIRKYTVCSLGWGYSNKSEDRLKNLEAQGFIEMIADIGKIFGRRR